MPTQDTFDRTLDERVVQAERSLGQPNEPYYRQRTWRGAARILGVVLLIVGLAWLFVLYRGGPALFVGRGNGTLINNTYTANRLVVDVRTGDVEVRTWNEPTVRVEAFYRGGSPQDYDVSVEPRGNTVTVSGGPVPSLLSFGARDVYYRISVPAEADTRVKTVNGDIDVAALSGETSLESTNGGIQASEIRGGLTATTVNGAMDLEQITGALQATSINGEIRLDDGNVQNARVETTNGEIELNGVAGNLEVKSVNGEIAIENATNAALTLSSTNSDIRFEGSLAGNATNTVDTVSGDVELRLPEASSFNLQANTVSGDISSDFQLADQQQNRRTLSGEANGGGGELKVSTTSGDIRVEAQ